MKTIVWITSIITLALTFASTTQAQTLSQRDTPTASFTDQRFVEIAEPGAMGDFQILALTVTPQRCTPVNPYASGPATVLQPKATEDLLIYDRTSGNALLVITTPFLGLGHITERFEFWTLREGVTWTVVDLDGDGNSDLIGHDKRTGEIVRAYRKNATTQCQH